MEATITFTSIQGQEDGLLGQEPRRDNVRKCPCAKYLLGLFSCNVFESFIGARVIHDLSTRSKGYFVAGSMIKRT